MLELTLKGDIGFTERIFIPEIMVLSVVSDYPKYHSIIGILQIAIYFGLQLYLNITSYLKSPFISICQDITASISYHRVSHNCSLYRLNQLSWFFNYPSLPEYHSIVISAQCVNRYLISLSITCWEMSQLVIWQLPMKANCQFSLCRLCVGSAKAAGISLQ